MSTVIPFPTHTLSRHQKFVLAEAIGRYQVKPSCIVEALSPHIEPGLLREVQAFTRRVAFNLNYVDPLDFNRRWTSLDFLLTEPDPDDEVCYRVRQLIGKVINGKKIASWLQVITPYTETEILAPAA